MVKLHCRHSVLLQHIALHISNVINMMFWFLRISCCLQDKLLPVCTTYFEMVRTSYEEGMKILGDLLTLDNVDVGGE